MAHVKAGDLPPVRIAEVISDPLGKYLPSVRNRRIHPVWALPAKRKEQPGCLNKYEEEDDPDE
jgi:hypothetical protein